MVYDFTGFKVPVYSGINDSPVAPTTTKGGNASHLISLYNSFIDNTENELNQIIDALNSIDTNSGSGATQGSSNWIITNNSYTANKGEKVFFAVNQPPFGVSEVSLTLPPRNEIGITVSFASSNGGFPVRLQSFGSSFNGNYYQGIYLQNHDFKQIDLLYAGGTLGWVCLQRDLLSYEYTAS